LTFSTLVFLSLTWIGSSCSKSTLNPPDFEGNTAHPVKPRFPDSLSSQYGFPIPAEADVFTIGDMLVIELPAGFEYLGINSSNLPMRIARLGVRCICEQGSGGCSPSKTTEPDGTKSYQCIMDSGCSDCKKKETSIASDYSEIDSVVVLGLLNHEAGFTFLTHLPNPSDSGEPSSVYSSIRNAEIIHGNAFSELLETDEFNEFLEGIEEWASTPGFPEAEKVKYMFNMLGNLCTVELPEGVEFQVGDTTYIPLIFGGPTKDVTCVCHEGTGCQYKKKNIPLVVKIEYCEAGNCKDCEVKD
jgi:hypothetical protein